LAEDSVFYQRNLDASGTQLTVASSDLMTFPAGQLPPMDEFWSITARGRESLDLIENEIQRYSIGNRTRGLVFNADGSLTLALQRDPPEDATPLANWLPVGGGPFYLVLRSYAPRPEIVTGT
jgi:hypothetical protein